jgi:hypothetical protein
MQLLSLDGRDCRIRKLHTYVIDWDGKSRSKFQFGVKQFLKKYWGGDIVFEEFPVPGTRLTVDLFNSSKRIVVEVQGGQHSEYTPHFHGKDHRLKFLQQLRRDGDKMKFCEINKLAFVEIYPDDELSEELFKKQGVDL